MRKLLYTAIISSLFFMVGCAGKGTIPSQALVKKISSAEESGNTTHYYFREKAFGGGAATVIFACNDKVYRVQNGEFVECPATETINFMSSDIGNGVFFTKLLETKISMPISNKIYLNHNDGNHYIFGTTSIFGKDTKTDNSISVDNTIEQTEAMKMISDGYKLVSAPDAISPTLRYTGILNPYSKYQRGAFLLKRFQPPQMITQHKIESLKDKQGIILFSTSNIVFSPGIWTKKEYQGSLDGDSYIFIETKNLEETLTTYFGGKLASLKVRINKGAISYVKFETTLGWEVHNRKFTLSNEQEFNLASPKLKHLVLNRDVDLEPSIDVIEREGLKILDSLLR
ncbi:hypothetical protein [Marinobacterium stanieri]|uniref:hypothetical protein n=1 Tax=Marinobacterium stanieri TaxID=49186 RepID=UPI003A91C110